MINNHMPPLKHKCPICRRTHLTEAPASHKRRTTADARLTFEKFGDVVDMDTLHLTVGKDGDLREATEWDASVKQGLVLLDRHTNDIDYFPQLNRTWRPVRDCLLQFGGHRDASRNCVCDKAPEFLRACKELNIAAFEGTPGRPTSHGKIERANRTTCEQITCVQITCVLALKLRVDWWQ